MFNLNAQKNKFFLKTGKIKKVIGLKVYVSGLNSVAQIGGRVLICLNSKKVPGEVISIENDLISIMPHDDALGLMEGMKVQYVSGSLTLRPDVSWAGRVLNGEGEPIDGKGLLPQGKKTYSIKNKPPKSIDRRLVEEKVDLGVKALNAFTTMCHGQRIGIFAGSGVGKTVLLSQLVRYSSVDFVVLGLVGERGREVGEFLNNVLTPEMRKKAILVVETSDSPALLRRQAAYITLTVAESLRDQGFNVLCMIDSVTRFAFAHREIGLSAGEIPTAKGYPPSVINEIASLLERAGPGQDNCEGKKQGNISGIFTVLVEGDDLQDPIADTVRSILDGHIVLDRNLAERNHYPAINILKSISRTVPACQSPDHKEVYQKAKRLLSDYSSMEDMINLGAYKKGTSKKIDEAIEKNDLINEFLNQKIDESNTIEESVALLKKVLE